MGQTFLQQGRALFASAVRAQEFQALLGESRVAREAFGGLGQKLDGLPRPRRGHQHARQAQNELQPLRRRAHLAQERRAPTVQGPQATM